MEPEYSQVAAGRVCPLYLSPTRTGPSRVGLKLPNPTLPGSNHETQGEFHLERDIGAVGILRSPLPCLPWAPTTTTALGLSSSVLLRLQRKREPPSRPGLFASSFSYPQTLPCDIVAVMGKRFVSFQSCYVGRLLRDLSVFSSHINMLPVTAPNTFCSKFQAILCKGVGWVGER